MQQSLSVAQPEPSGKHEAAPQYPSAPQMALQHSPSVEHGALSSKQPATGDAHVFVPSQIALQQSAFDKHGAPSFAHVIWPFTTQWPPWQ